MFNQALQSQVFPKLWQGFKVRLLGKKSNPTSLRNWRPISLINCDARIYTRTIDIRLREVILRLINRSQSGFVLAIFIAESTLVLQAVVQYARHYRRNDIALDQAKACDGVHSSYLHQNLLQFDFPTDLVCSLGWSVLYQQTLCKY